MNSYEIAVANVLEKMSYNIELLIKSRFELTARIKKLEEEIMILKDSKSNRVKNLGAICNTL